MKRVGFYLLSIFVSTTLFAGEGEVLISSQLMGTTLYVDNEKNTTIEKEITLLKLQEGTHVLKVAKPINEQCQKYGKKEIYVSSDSSQQVTLALKKKLEPTEEYQKILDKKEGIKAQRFHRSKCMIVSDRKLGLMWQDDDIPNSTKRDLNAAKKYCNELEFSIFDDWRLPTYEELLTIVDYDRYDSSIVRSFQSSFSQKYWSISADVAAPNYAWIIDFHQGKTGSTMNSERHHVRCVRNK